ncbi:MAG: acyl-CoA dehydrogenase family protein [Pseudomonadota bacterium]
MFDAMFKPEKGHDWITDEHSMFAESARRFFEAELAPHRQKFRDQKEVDRDFWNKAGENGFLAPSIPEEFGGSAAPRSFDAVIAYEASRTGDTSWGYGIQSFVIHYVMNYGTPEQKTRYLPKLASGDMVAALAMTEPSTGSDLQKITTNAVLQGDTYVINGSKTFITNGGQADLILLAVKTDKTLGAKGTSLILVETKDDNGKITKGFRRGRRLEKLGMPGQDTHELFFEDMEVPADRVLGGAVGMGFVFLMQQLGWERLSIGIQAVGAMDFMLTETLNYTRDRKAFGQRVFDFQNTKFKLAEVKSKLEVCRAFVKDALGKLDRGELDETTASIAKWYCSQMQCEVADECLQLHGGYGFMMEYPITQAYADCRVQKIYGGTNEIMKELIARSLDK